MMGQRTVAKGNRRLRSRTRESVKRLSLSVAWWRGTTPLADPPGATGLPDHA
jgi:hypothetical protein